MVRAAFFLLLGVVCGGGACHTGTEPLLDVNARILVVGVDDDEVVVLDVADKSYRADDVDDGLVEMQLALPEGTHEGFVTIVRARDDREDEPRECGTFTITVTDGDVSTVAIIVDDLPRCDDDDDDDDEVEDPEDEPEDEPGDDNP